MCAVFVRVDGICFCSAFPAAACATVLPTCCAGAPAGVPRSLDDAECANLRLVSAAQRDCGRDCCAVQAARCVALLAAVVCFCLQPCLRNALPAACIACAFTNEECAVIGASCWGHRHSCSPAEWWLEALAALSENAEAACKAGGWLIVCSPLSQLTDRYLGTHAAETYLGPDSMLFAMAGFSSLHYNLHERLRASDAAAAQRTEAGAVAAAHSCLRAARAVEGWQGELAAKKRGVFEDAIDAFTVHLCVLNLGPAFSCEAATSPGSPRIPGGRAVAAVMEAVQLAAEALQAVAGLPSLRAVQLRTFSRGGSVPVGICSVAAEVGWQFLSQTLPGLQVQLLHCIRGEQVQPMAPALLRLLHAEVRAVFECARSVGCPLAWQSAHGYVEGPAAVNCSSLLRML